MLISSLCLLSFLLKGQGNMETITLGSGCFWCTEAVYEEVKGVESVTSGYSGGEIKNPSYREICTGRTGHAEVVQLSYDPKVISTAEILEIFWLTHDPTTLNRQGNDVGTQYRSVIFYHNEDQKKIAQYYLNKLKEEKVYPNPIVTEITEFDRFYPAENYHQNYFELNESQPYCQYVIQPKLEKFRKVFADKIKSDQL